MHAAQPRMLVILVHQEALSHGSLSSSANNKENRNTGNTQIQKKNYKQKARKTTSEQALDLELHCLHLRRNRAVLALKDG